MIHSRAPRIRTYRPEPNAARAHLTRRRRTFSTARPHGRNPSYTPHEVVLVDLRESVTRVCENVPKILWTEPARWQAWSRRRSSELIQPSESPKASLPLLRKVPPSLLNSAASLRTYLITPTVATWNQIARWLHQIDGVRGACVNVHGGLNGRPREERQRTPACVSWRRSDPRRQ